MSTKPAVVVMSSGLFIPWGHKLIAVIESCKPPRQCSTCGVFTACKDLTGDVCDANVRDHEKVVKLFLGSFITNLAISLSILGQHLCH